MKAFGTEVAKSEGKIIYRGREYALLGCTCLHCDYDFFVPALPEHEPSLCPNCAMRFKGCAVGVPDKSP